MTSRAICRRALKWILNVSRRFHSGANLLHRALVENCLLAESMTICAGCVCVFPGQRESSFLVIEMDHAILTVVADYTVFSKVIDVLDHKSSIFFGMTDGAILERCLESFVRRMASRTFHRGCIVIYLMPDQAEARDRVIEFAERSLGKVKVQSLMIGVAQTALVDVRNMIVYAVFCFDLGRDIRMTIHTKHILSCF